MAGVGAFLVLVAGCGEVAKPSAGKLQVFILAGQSNMVGHASYITVPALLAMDAPDARAMAQTVFKEGAVAPGDAKALIEARVGRDRLERELDENKIQGTAAIAAARAEVKRLTTELDARTERMKDAFTVSQRVYITSIADGHRRSGALTFGYGGGATDIGPELGFGLGIEKKLDGPILLIKTSWGGKSLHYDFRPPSAGPYELNEQQKKLEDPEYIQVRAKASEEYKKVWLPKARKAIAAFWVEHDKFMARQLSPERYAEWRKTAADWHEAVSSPSNGGPDALKPWKVWALERKAQAFFKGTDIQAPTMNFEKTLWKQRPALAEGPDAQAIRDNAGLNYRMMTQAVREVLTDPGKYHPDYDPAAGHEIAGFVWFQGYNDQFSDAFHGNYKNNMIAFINDVRGEYKTPQMPFVIGVLGTGATKEAVAVNPVSVAQRQAAAAPQFKGSVASVESYPFSALKALAMWKDGSWSKKPAQFGQIGSDRPYHYMGSGQLFVRFGAAMADAMAGMMKNPD